MDPNLDPNSDPCIITGAYRADGRAQQNRPFHTRGDGKDGGWRISRPPRCASRTSSLTYRKHGFPRGELRSPRLGRHNGHAGARAPGLGQPVVKFAFKAPAHETGDVRDKRSPRTGPARPVERLRQVHCLRLAPHPRDPTGWARLVRGNCLGNLESGGCPGLLRFPAVRLEMTSSSFLEMRASAISTRPPFPPPTGDRPTLNVVGQPQP
jgi:hypothetical protein